MTTLTFTAVPVRPVGEWLGRIGHVLPGATGAARDLAGPLGSPVVVDSNGHTDPWGNRRFTVVGRPLMGRWRNIAVAVLESELSLERPGLRAWECADPAHFTDCGWHAVVDGLVFPGHVSAACAAYAALDLAGES